MTDAITFDHKSPLSALFPCRVLCGNEVYDSLADAYDMALEDYTLDELVYLKFVNNPELIEILLMTGDMPFNPLNEEDKILDIDVCLFNVRRRIREETH